MQSRQYSQTKNTQKQTSAFSISPVQGMFESRPFVVQQQTTEKSQQPDLKTSLMQAKRYGHHLGQIQAASVSEPIAAQPKMEIGKPVQLAKAAKTNTPKTIRKRKKNPLGLKVDTRRDASGFVNPGHKHSKMRPLFENAAVSPRDHTRPLDDWLYSPSRRFFTHTPTHTQAPGITQGHSNTVMGHNPDAVSRWNTYGHKNPRKDNFDENRQTSFYHGLEDRASSNASGGATKEGYLSPSPTQGSHPSYFDVRHPDFNRRNPWENRFREPDGKGGYQHVIYDPNKKDYVPKP
ncbi:hypothetical protein [Nostoc sp.]